MPLWVETIRNVAYGEQSENVLDVLQPRRVSGPLPVVVVFHGGGWLSGSRRDVREKVCRRFLARGFLVFDVDYRLRLSTAAEDATRALEWTFRNAAAYGGDAGRIVTMGESAGAHLALMAAFRGPTPRAVVNFYGIAEPRSMAGGQVMREALAVETNPGEALLLSPAALVRPGLCPVLSIHGTADPIVPYEQSVRLTESLRRAGVEAELFTVDQGGHGFRPAQVEQAYAAVFGFLKRVGVAQGTFGGL
jgi:acetyl esterase/lipase